MQAGHLSRIANLITPLMGFDDAAVRSAAVMCAAEVLGVLAPPAADASRLLTSSISRGSEDGADGAGDEAGAATPADAGVDACNGGTLLDTVIGMATYEGSAAASHASASAASQQAGYVVFKRQAAPGSFAAPSASAAAAAATSVVRVSEALDALCAFAQAHAFTDVALWARLIAIAKPAAASPDQTIRLVSDRV
jgi:hypothetical protein